MFENSNNKQSLTTSPMNKLGIDIKMKNEKGKGLLFKKIKLDSLMDFTFIQVEVVSFLFSIGNDFKYYFKQLPHLE